MNSNTSNGIKYIVHSYLRGKKPLSTFGVNSIDYMFNPNMYNNVIIESYKNKTNGKSFGSYVYTAKAITQFFAENAYNINNFSDENNIVLCEILVDKIKCFKELNHFNIEKRRFIPGGTTSLERWERCPQMNKKSSLSSIIGNTMDIMTFAQTFGFLYDNTSEANEDFSLMKNNEFLPILTSRVETRILYTLEKDCVEIYSCPESMQNIRIRLNAINYEYPFNYNPTELECTEYDNNSKINLIFNMVLGDLNIRCINESVKITKQIIDSIKNKSVCNLSKNERLNLGKSDRLSILGKNAMELIKF